MVVKKVMVVQKVMVMILKVLLKNQRNSNVDNETSNKSQSNGNVK